MKSNGNLIWGIIFIAVAITILTLTSCGIKIPIHSCETPISKNLTCEELLICHNQRDTQNNRQMFRNFDKDWGWLLEEKCSKQKESHSYEGEFPRKTNTRDYSMIWFAKNTSSIG